MEFSTTLKATHEGKRGVFSDDGKKRISIVSSLDFTQDVSRIKHKKPGSKATCIRGVVYGA
jgi:hypothetical protein